MGRERHKSEVCTVVSQPKSSQSTTRPRRLWVISDFNSKPSRCFARAFRGIFVLGLGNSRRVAAASPKALRA